MTGVAGGGPDFAAAHDELRSVARAALGPVSPLVTGGSVTAPDRTALADAGWLGLEVPEALGGAGATFAETALILEELGRAAAAGDGAASMGLGVGALEALAPGESRDRALSGLAAGELSVAVAIPTGDEAVGPVEPLFTATGEGGVQRVDGRADFVLDAPGADLILLIVNGPGGRPGGVLVAPGTPGLRVDEQPVVDPSRCFGRVVADGVVPDQPLMELGGELGGEPGAALGRLLDRAATATSADSLGIAASVLDATVAYAGARRQFGRPIGSFQAVKHACADMLVDVTVGRELLRAAVAGVVSGGDPVAASRAKSQIGAMAVRVAGQAVQLHGGIGYTWERGLHVYLKRAALNRSLFGAPAAHRRRLARRYSR